MGDGGGGAPSRAERPVWGLRTTSGPGRHQTDIQLCGCSWREGTHNQVRKNKPNSSALVEKWAQGLGLGLLLWVSKELLPPPLPNFVRYIFSLQRACAQQVKEKVNSGFVLPALTDWGRTYEMRYLMCWSTASDEPPVWVQRGATVC